MGAISKIRRTETIMPPKLSKMSCPHCGCIMDKVGNGNDNRVIQKFKCGICKIAVIFKTLDYVRGR